MLESKRINSCLVLGLAVLAGLPYASLSQAQVVPDNTSTVVNYDENDRNFRVTGGIRAESSDSINRNLFHSFESFSIDSGETVTFSEVADIQNIFSRVTGGGSVINGTIRIDPTANANLFLINPNGIIFGPEAVIDINGSFVASTASNIQFENGFFGTEGPQTEPSLLINVPVGLQFGSRAASIAVNGYRPPSNAPGTSLNVAPGNTLALVGGNIRLNQSQLSAPAGRIELVSVSPENTVGVSSANRGFIFNSINISQFQDIFLQDRSVLSTSDEFSFSQPNGDITLVGRVISVDNSSISADSQIFFVDDNLAQPGDITLFASDLVEINNQGSVTTLNSNYLFDNLPSFENIGGDINITSNRLNIDNGSIKATVEFQGQAGNIVLRVGESIHLLNRAQIEAADFGIDGSSTAGNIDISTSTLIIEDGSQINSSAIFRGGSAGTIQVTANQSLQIRGAIQGDSGSINSGLFTVNQGDLNAGDLTVTSRNVLVEDQGTINASARGQGTGGTLTVNTEQLTVRSGGQITASTRTGTAGSVIVEAPAGRVDVEGVGSLIAARADNPDGNDGNAGSVNISARQIDVSHGGTISVSSNAGQAGNLSLAADTILLDSGSLRAVTGITPESGSGANILLSDVVLLRMSDGSLISASALAAANGGNINIDASQGYVIAVLNENNDITANAIEGTGGNITITTRGLYNFREGPAIPGNQTNDIDASSEFGQSGTISINDPTIDPSQARVELPETALDADNLIDRSCSTDTGQGRNSFMVTGRGGLPPSPGEIVRSDHTELINFGPDTETTTHSPESTTATLPESSAQPLQEVVEAQTWYRSASGTAVLTAQLPESSSFSLPIQTFCDRHLSSDQKPGRQVARRQ